MALSFVRWFMTACRLTLDTVTKAKRQRLFWLDDDYRISMSVSVIFGGGVGRIVQPYTIYQELVSVLAGRQIKCDRPIRQLLSRSSS